MKLEELKAELALAERQAGYGDMRNNFAPEPLLIAMARALVEIGERLDGPRQALIDALAEIETLREEVALWRATGIDPRMGIRPTGWKWPQENLS